MKLCGESSTREKAPPEVELHKKYNPSKYSKFKLVAVLPSKILLE